MKKILLLVFMAIVTFTDGFAQTQYPSGYLTGDMGLSDYDFILPPKSMTSGAFGYDFYYYQWGCEMRDSAGVSEKALSDEAAELYTVFGTKDVLGIELSRESTPEIILLCERAVSDAHVANTAVKDKYQRRRPFATFNEASLKPNSDEEEAATFSYPSGHSSRGYIFALALSSLVPSRTTEIMLRAQEYALNRVICGHHWKSDTDASLLLAAAMFANIVCTDAYQEQFKKAKEELSIVTGVSAARFNVKQRSAAMYDLQGRRVENADQQGVYIQQGQKIVVK